MKNAHERFGWLELRRSREMTHLCSDRVTHTKNTIWNRFAREQKLASDIIHAEGVRGCSPIIPARRARKSLGCQDGDLRTKQNRSDWPVPASS